MESPATSGQYGSMATRFGRGLHLNSRSIKSSSTLMATWPSFPLARPTIKSEVATFTRTSDAATAGFVRMRPLGLSLESRASERSSSLTATQPDAVESSKRARAAKQRVTHVFRPGDVTYLRIPAPDPGKAAAFYERVFGWEIRGEPESPCFADASGHVIGRFMPEQPVADGESGVQPYVYVDDLYPTLERALQEGGELVRAPYRDGALRIATVRDPCGNLIGIWQNA